MPTLHAIIQDTDIEYIIYKSQNIKITYNLLKGEYSLLSHITGTLTFFDNSACLINKLSNFTPDNFLHLNYNFYRDIIKLIQYLNSIRCSFDDKNIIKDSSYA